ncbi:inner membrane protein YhjD [Mycobacterium sp.]|uniref:inner membrane protein YhjD n=1 Tax=Mycobacterium sp. TaxID=1785 RepID=UPI003A846443
MSGSAEPTEPSFVDRLRDRYGWFDHAMRARERFSGSNGGFYAAGLSYYTILALFPMLMVGFASVGFMLSRRPAVLHDIDVKVVETVSGPLASQLLAMMNSAIDARTSVGIIGLATSTWAGLSWMSHLRVALSEMWAQTCNDGFVRSKISDLWALIGTFLVIIATLGLTALGHAEPMRAVLKWLGAPELSIFDWIFRLISVLVSLLVSWLLFAWMIARLPREPVRFGASIRAAVLATVAYEVFKQVASMYLRVVMRSPAGATFGPVLGLMVFINVAGLLLLFATAWAATMHPEDACATAAEGPVPAAVGRWIRLDEGLPVRQAVAALAAGAAGALAISRFVRGKR